MTIKNQRKFKREKLASLKDEVKEFHPLLDAFLHKLPRINHVEYTHGNNEKGADFLIQRLDDTIGDTEYIGIVVKRGSIKSSLTNIYDQIEDCASERIIFNGSKKIKLDEIWIISNENITSRAKEKINEKYFTRKIKFIDRDTLIGWIDNFFVNFWTSIPVDVGQYLANINQSMDELDIAHSLLPAGVEPFYVKMNLRQVEHNYAKANKNKRPKIDIYQLIDKQPISIIEGGPGSGKSQMVRNAAKHFSDPQVFETTNIVPIYVTYQNFANNYSSDVKKLITDRLKKINKDDHESLTTILFVDGFDESINKSRDIHKEVKQLIEDVQQIQDTQLIITTRPLDLIDFETYLYEIIPFEFGQMVSIFNNICSKIKIADRLFEDIRKSDLFKQLPRNPISAILLARLVSENSKELPANLTDIYKKYTELMLGRWDIDKGLQSDKEYEVGKNILAHIANYLIEHDLSIISSEEALTLFNEYLNQRNLKVSGDELFNKIVTRSGILQENAHNKTIYFKHRSFAEFFYAQYKANHYDRSFIDNRAFSPIWKNIFFFYVGINKDCEEILEAMLQLEVNDHLERFLRVTNMAEYFLAAYTTPYKIVEKYLPFLINDFRKMYLQVVNNEIETPFDFMPEIMVLEFFQAIINESYSYEFFLKALDNTILKIGTDDLLSEEEKAYSLFFISVIYRALDMPNPFDQLIDDFKGHLPQPIQFGLFYECQRDTKPSKQLKKVQKKLKSKLKKQYDFKKYAIRLHELPVKQLDKE